LGLLTRFTFEEGAMNLLQNTQRRLGIVGELLTFFWRNKRWWVVPIIVVVLLMSVLLILAQSSAVAPFIYALF
jgi:hypothetical protein